MRRPVFLAAMLVALTGCGGSTASSGPLNTAAVERTFARQGIPLAFWRVARIAGYPVTELNYDPAKLTTTTATGHVVLNGQWLVVLVFRSASAATKALHAPSEAESIRAFGLTVVARGNLVATILRDESTPGRLRRVRAAVAAAIAR